MRFALVSCAVLVVSTAVPAAAQPAAAPFERGYVHVNFGGQVGSSDLDQPGSFPLYEDTAVFNTRGEVGGGALFDVGGGYRVWRQLYAGVSYSRTSDRTDATLTGAVPNPLFTNRPPRPISAPVAGLKHTEHAIHLQAVWRQPITEAIHVAVFAGPTLFSIDQDVVGSFTVNEPPGLPGIPALDQVTLASANESTTGFHAGADVSYRIRPRIRVGFLLRYAGGSADLPAANEVTSLDVGGLQVGAGIRYGF
jgi:opacity protein-like surface antigen